MQAITLIARLYDVYSPDA